MAVLAPHTTGPHLTSAQRDAAERLAADGCFPAAGMSGAVFLYCTRDDQTVRWLVDAAGEVVEVATFHAG